MARRDIANGYDPLAYLQAGVSQPAARLVDIVLPRLREIRHDDTYYGLAALRTSQTVPQDFLTANSVGGFVTHDSHGRFGMID